MSNAIINLSARQILVVRSAVVREAENYAQLAVETKRTRKDANAAGQAKVDKRVKELQLEARGRMELAKELMAAATNGSSDLVEIQSMRDSTVPVGDDENHEI